MKSVIRRHLFIVVSLLLSIFLFSLSFPGFANQNGISFLIFIALLPMFNVLFRLNYIEAPIYGFLFGLCKYLVFNYWLKEFDPIAYGVAPGIQGIYFAILFPLMLYFHKRFPKIGYIPILFAWFSFEVFKSTNSVGYSYGLLAQTMYRTHLFTGIVDIVGSYPLSLLLLFPTLLFSFLCTQTRKKKRREWIIPAIVYITLMSASVVYTKVNIVDYSNSQKIRVSLVQHNLNCWLSSSNPVLYIQAYDHLEELSKRGEDNGAEVVIWPETAFVPAIEWHKKYRPINERARLDLIIRMEKYLRETKALYIIGNNESFNIKRDKSYNTAYLFNKDEIIARYRKINLVPFTEQFPYPDRFPKLFEYVTDLGATQVTPGDNQELFEINGVKSTILICYEDAFPELPRQGVLNGSNLLVNITNDAWTSSTASPLQHLAAAALRTIETRRTLVRSGTSGFTGVIDPNGKIIASLPLFTKDELTFDAPIYSDKITIYTKYGHIIDYVGYYLLGLIMIFSIFKEIKVKFKR